jgi:transcription elongation factor/antiterminator RfaH
MVGVDSNTSWYVIRTNPHQELRAELNLNQGAIETFLPWVHRWPSGRLRRRDREALFPQYLFARFDSQRLLHDVTYTRGVQGVVRFGTELAAIDDTLIQHFRSRIDAAGLIPIGDELEPGARVTIKGGPFAELSGVIERRLPSRHRVLVLLTAVGAGARVELPVEEVQVH